VSDSAERVKKHRAKKKQKASTEEEARRGAQLVSREMAQFADRKEDPKAREERAVAYLHLPPAPPVGAQS
jgi:hypothetical protein